jgi:autotransporter translocation and assembly factor TamB
MKTKALKFIGIGLAALAIVVILGVSFFPTGKIKQELERAASSALDQQVTIDKVKFSVVPVIGATLSGLSIGNPADLALGKPTVSVNEITVGVKLLPLLKKEVQITRVLIDKPNITLQQSDTKPKKDQQVASKNVLPVISIRQLQIKKGEITILDPKGKRSTYLGDINESLAASIRADQNLELQGTLTVGKFLLAGGKFGKGLSLKLDKKIAYSLQDDSLKIERGDVLLGDLPLKLTGQAEALLSDQPTIDLQLKGGPASVASILGYLPSNLFPATRGVQSSGQLLLEFFAKGKIDSKAKSANGLPPGLDFKGTLKLSDGTLKYPALPLPVKGIELIAAIDTKQVTITSFKAATAKSKISAAGNVKDYLKTKLTYLKLKADIDLDEAAKMQPAELGAKLSGRSKIDITVKGEAKDPKKLSYAGTAQFENIYAEHKDVPAPISTLNGALQFSQSTIAIQSLKGKFGSNPFAIKGKIVDYQQNPAINLVLQILVAK